ncbi:MAG: gamma-glutamyl-gamma-aminobutyrate hydrolase family protein [Phycisphaerales bacterium]
MNDLHTTAPTPLIGITCDVDQADARRFLRPGYTAAVIRAGGVPVMLEPDVNLIDAYLNMMHGFIFTGGDDPIMHDFGEQMHPQATAVHPDRQQFECTLLRELDTHHPNMPVLGICLGMQYMALVHGGRLDQYIGDSHPQQLATHWGKTEHDVTLTLAGASHEGTVLSHHRQAVTDAGSLTICGTSQPDDGVIEAVCDTDRCFYLGVQWHPERTKPAVLGDDLFRALVRAAAAMHMISR